MAYKSTLSESDISAMRKKIENIPKGVLIGILDKKMQTKNLQKTKEDIEKEKINLLNEKIEDYLDEEDNTKYKTNYYRLYPKDEPKYENNSVHKEGKNNEILALGSYALIKQGAMELLHSIVESKLIRQIDREKIFELFEKTYKENPDNVSKSPIKRPIIQDMLSLFAYRYGNETSSSDTKESDKNFVKFFNTLGTPIDDFLGIDGYFLIDGKHRITVDVTGNSDKIVEKRAKTDIILNVSFDDFDILHPNGTIETISPFGNFISEEKETIQKRETHPLYQELLEEYTKNIYSIYKNKQLINAINLKKI